jgi:hypothetical protein
MICDVQEQSQHYELLLELPPEILDCILLQFCDGKALSTLALTFATSHRCQFHLERLHGIKRLLFSQLAEDIRRDEAALDSEISFLKSRHSDILQWMQSVERTSHSLEPMRSLSEDFAAIDFLRRRGMQHPRLSYEPKWGGLARVDRCSVGRHSTCSRGTIVLRCCANVWRCELPIF